MIDLFYTENYYIIYIIVRMLLVLFLLINLYNTFNSKILMYVFIFIV